ncbi:hypothetical protein ACFRCI_03285 [Streptomyces sp. NPDC056638]|uniref:hypothetical protein n=1 Tax=Streptomyces sp. NPDC056638 TaxID=3345887 RepID=UPI00368B27FA
MIGVEAVLAAVRELENDGRPSVIADGTVGFEVLCEVALVGGGLDAPAPVAARVPSLFAGAPAA